MAAGKVHVSRRGEFYHLPNQVSDASEYGRYYVGLRGDRGFSGGNDTWVRNYEKKRDGRGYEYGHVSRKTKRGLLLDGRLSVNGLNRELQIRAAEAVDVDSGDMLPSEKKRKFSPVILHMEEHNFALTSKNNAMVAEISISSPSSVNKLALPCAADESPVHFSLTQEMCMNDEREPGQLDEEDFSHAPNISTSRWAYDDDLLDNNHRDGDRDVLRMEEKRKKTESPESGVIQREGSDVCRARSSLYDGDECLGSESDNTEAMEVDKTDVNEGLDASESDLESEHVADDRVAECGSSDMRQECRCVSDYEKLGKINEGSYGVVYRARDKKTGELVALKKLKMGVEREGFPLYYLREINILLSFNHPSIVNVKEVVVDNGNAGFDNVFMVMEYMEHDLKGLIQSRNQPFSQSEVKCLMLQLLEGVKYLHDHWVLHRDLKTSNLLLNNKGELKICDFGMSRQYGSPLKPYTPWVVTLWYRAPELLLGAKEYSTAVDMWSVGCIMAELLSNKPLFDGKTEFDQLDKIFKTLGTPTERIWPGYSQLPGVKINIVQHPYNVLHKKFPRTSFTGSPVLSDLGLDLLSQLLTYDPDKRITAEDALNHGWFHEVPLPKCKDFMPTFPALHSQKR